MRRSGLWCRSAAPPLALAGEEEASGPLRLQTRTSRATKQVYLSKSLSSNVRWVDQTIRDQIGAPIDGTVNAALPHVPGVDIRLRLSQFATQLSSRRGGARDARLLAVVTNRPGSAGQSLSYTNEGRPARNSQIADAELDRRAQLHTGKLLVDS